MRKSSFAIVLMSFLAVSCGKGGNSAVTPGDDAPGDYSISGVVTGDDGSLLPDVVVSDGINCVKTDSKGRYFLSSDLNVAEYVFVSTPSAWSAPVRDGQACFWRFLSDCTAGSDGKYVVDFTLNKISAPERYTIFIFADPQPRKSTAGYDKIGYHSLDCCNDMYRDMKEFAAALGNRQIYGIDLGDIVHQDLSLLAAYKKGMATTGISTYNVIGNHDQGHSLMDDAHSSKAYEEQMGPANYSFNLGGMHYLVLDNMISPDPSTGKYSDDCSTGLTDDIWQFVQNDLALVSRDTPLMVCAHSPMARMLGGSERSGAHLSELRALLSKYVKAYLWAGHTHSSFNYVNKSDPVIETHTLSRTTGALWTNEYLGSNGTPRGYTVFNYDNGDVSWRFKPIYYQTGSYVGNGNGGSVPGYAWRDWDYANGRAVLKSTGEYLDDSYQMQVFPPGTYGDSYVYANVFLWDELWQTPRLTVDGVPSLMKRVTEPDYMYSYSDYSITSFYNSNTVAGSNFVPDKNNNASMFRAYTDAEHGSGTVSVRDRFGNVHSSVITW